MIEEKYCTLLSIIITIITSPVNERKPFSNVFFVMVQNILGWLFWIQEIMILVLSCCLYWFCLNFSSTMLSCCLWWHCLVFFLWLCRGKVDVETSQSRVSKAFLEFSLKKTSPGRWSGLTQPHIPGRYSRYCRYPSLILSYSANRHIF